MNAGQLAAPARQVIASLPIPRLLMFDAGDAATPPEIELSDRSEQGRRAMRLPDRVAAALDTSRVVLRAPVRNDREEMAGLSLSDADQPLSPGHDHDRWVRELLVDAVLASDVIPPQSAADRSPPVEAETASGELVGPTRPPSWEAESTKAVPRRPASMLPASIQALAKHWIRLPVPDPTPSANVIGSSTSVTSDALDPPALDKPSWDPVPLVEPIVEPSPGATLVPRVVPRDQPDVTGGAEGGPADVRPWSDPSPVAWPITARLDDQLQRLSAIASPPAGPHDGSSTAPTAVNLWTGRVARTLAELRSLPRLGDHRGGTLIDELERLAVEGAESAEMLEDRSLQIEWLSTSYALARRTAVWRPIWEVSSNQAVLTSAHNSGETSAPSIGQTLAAVRDDLPATGDPAGWTRFLLLDEIDAAAGRADRQTQTLLAQRLLSRLDWHGIDAGQAEWLRRDSVRSLASAVRPWAQDAVDYANLLGQIERQESDAVDLGAITIADAVQTLRFAENEKAVEIASAIDTHYRNANVRIALSQAMLERVLPRSDARTVPVRTQLLGNRVRGTSRVESDLRIQLQPSPDRWSLQLQAIGNVRTQSTGLRGPVAVRTAGDSSFTAITPIEITARGVQLGDTEAEVNGRTRLRGIDTDFDGWPLIGSLMHSIAASQYEAVAPRSNRLANQKIGQQIETQLHAQLEQRVETAAEQLSEMLLGPLGKLKLNPQVTDLQTTEQRLLARYRVAGDWQLAAFTARPRAPGTSLMSLQVHQSALNNVLEQLVPRDQPMSIRQVLQSGAANFGQPQLAIPDDIPDEVMIQFAPTRPITVEIEEGIVWVTLRIMRLSRRDQGELTKFIVRAAYTPQLDGMQASLVREGHLRISGPSMSMRERLPVRAIFNKVLSANRPVPLMPPRLVDHPAVQGLAVSQLELSRGWIAIAISESSAPRIALQTPALQSDDLQLQ
jgi:hypothetical protein